MTRILTTSLVALALLVAGCGGDDAIDDARFARQAAEVGKALDEAFVVFALDLGDPASVETAAAQLEEGADLLARAASGFAEVEPPSGVAGIHGRIVDAVEALAERFGEAAEAAQEGDVDALLAFEQEVQSSEALEALAAASDEMEAAGYAFMPTVGGAEE